MSANEITPTRGTDLADLRRSYGLTQEDVAVRLGVHRVTVSNWERAAQVSAINAAEYRRAAEQAAREAMLGTAEGPTPGSLLVVEGA